MPRHSSDDDRREKKEPWVLHYWPSSGKGDFVRLMFEEAGVTYAENNNSGFLHDTYLTGDKPQRGYPAFVVPVITREGFKLGQTPAICKYLGRHYGIYPKGEQDQWHADAANLTIHDFYAEIAKDDFSTTFIDERVPKFLKHFETLLAENEHNEDNVKSIHLFGKRLTYVDLALFQILRLLKAKYPETWAEKIVPNAPMLIDFFKGIGSRPRVAAFLKSDKARALIEEPNASTSAGY